MLIYVLIGTSLGFNKMLNQISIIIFCHTVLSVLCICVCFEVL